MKRSPLIIAALLSLLSVASGISSCSNIPAVQGKYLYSFELFYQGLFYPGSFMLSL